MNNLRQKLWVQNDNLKSRIYSGESIQLEMKYRELIYHLLFINLVCVQSKQTIEFSIILFGDSMNAILRKFIIFW